MTIGSKKGMPFCVFRLSRLYFVSRLRTNHSWSLKHRKLTGKKTAYSTKFVGVYVTAGCYSNDPESVLDATAAEGIQWLRHFYNERNYYLYLKCKAVIITVDYIENSNSCQSGQNRLPTKLNENVHAVSCRIMYGMT